MPEDLEPEELARAKKLARGVRIRNIRRRVAVTGAALAAVFSGVILVRTQLGQPAEAGATETAMVTNAGDEQQGSGEGSITETVVKVASGYAIDAVFGDDDESSSDDGSGSAPSLVTGQS